MPCPHNEITIVQRSQRQSAVAAAAYQSGAAAYTAAHRAGNLRKVSCFFSAQNEVVKHHPIHQLPKGGTRNALSTQ